MITIKNRFPLLKIDDFFDQLGETRVIFKVDLKFGYYQVK